MRVSVELRASLALFERIFGYLDIEPDIEDSPNAASIHPRDVAGRVTLDDVSLSYESERPTGPKLPSNDSRSKALDGVSLEIQPGQTAAFVGPSGAGKTSISYLIPRLYDPNEGAVRIDGMDVRDIRLDSLAAIVGYVTQESYLFHASVRSNLQYARPGATQEELGGRRKGRLHP